MIDSRACDWRFLVGSDGAWVVEDVDFHGGWLQIVKGDRSLAVLCQEPSSEIGVESKHTLVAKLDALPLRSGVASFAYLNLQGSEDRDRAFAARCMAEQYRVLAAGASACFVLVNTWTTIRPEKRGAGGLRFYQSVARSVGFRSVTAWAPLPRLSGNHLAIVPLSSTPSFQYLLRHASSIAATVSPEVRRAYRAEYLVARGMARLAAHRALARLVKYFVPGFLLVVKK